MKKSFISLGLIVAATFALTNCAKEFENPSQKPESAGIPFEISASTPDTKTANDGLNTVWVAGDAINLFHAEAGSTSYKDDGKFSVAAADVDAGRFTGTLGGDLEAGKSYDWYAFYPYSSYTTTPVNTSGGRTYIGCRSDGSQAQVGLDNMDHIAGVNYPLYGYAKSVSADTRPTVAMTHVSSLIEIVVTNTLSEDLNVENISFTAPEDIVGYYYINFAGEECTFTKYNTYQSNTANLTVSDAVIPAGGKGKFYLAVKPFTATEGDAFKIVVQDCIIEKELGQNETIAFASGKIKTINVSYTKPDDVLVGVSGIKSVITTTTDTPFVADLTDAVVTFVSGNNAYIQDAEAGILIFAQNHGLVKGDKLTGRVSGTGKLYNGLREITAISYEAEDKTSDAEVPVTTVTIAQLSANYDKYENMRVKIEGAEVTSGGFTQDGTTIAYYKKNNSVTGYDLYNYVDVVGYLSKYNTVQFNVWENAVVKGASQTVFTGFAETLSVGVDATVANKAVPSSGAAVSYVSDDAGVATVDAEGNVTGVSAGTATITASVAAYNGYPAATATCIVTVSTNAVQPITVILSAASRPCDTFPNTSAGVTVATTYTIDGYDWTFSPSSGNKFSWYDNGKYILWGQAGGYILMPSVEGKSLKTVKILTGTGASTSVMVGVYEEDGSVAVSGGDAIKLNAKNAEFSWNLSGTQPGGRYQLRVTSKHNAQLQTLTCVYE